MSSPPIGRDDDFNRLWKGAQSTSCAGCHEHLPLDPDTGLRGKAVVDKVRRRVLIYCEECHDILEKEGRLGSVKKGIEKDPSKLGKRKKVYEKISEFEEEEEDDEEEDEGDDEFADFFASIAGRAVKLMFKHMNKRINEIEKRIFKD